MGLSMVAQCRGEGVGYIAFSDDCGYTGLSARARTADGTDVPCELFHVDSPTVRHRIAPGTDAVWVVVVPLLARSCVVELAGPEGTVHHVAFGPKRSKVASRLLSARKPEVAGTLRGYEYRYGHGRCAVVIDRAWPADEGRVTWRVHVSYPVGKSEADGPAPLLQAFDAWAKPIDAQIICMEDHVVPGARDRSMQERLIAFSCTMPEDVAQFYLQVALAGDKRPKGFAGMNAARAHGMLNDTRRMTAGAQDDTAYAFWLEEHRATSRDLAWQRAACADLAAEKHPLVSVVIPACPTTKADIRQAIASVQAQSYDRWELIVAGADDIGESTRAVTVAAKRPTLGSALLAGIAQASGAYVALLYPNAQLEADALWHLVQAAVRTSEADLLYSDEDCLDNGRGCMPSFKTFPNYGALYSRNYVGGLLMLSRTALDRMGFGCAEAADLDTIGSYDLVLRGFEVARAIERVPRVLYHVRLGERIDNTDEAQAHETGRQALQEHLNRRHIQAQVGDGPLPQTYRVQYRLPDPLPRVSIVIPTRDHADLLRTCVTSILERSTYSNLQVVLVENNSEDPHTFALYNELTARDTRVTVTAWQPDEPGTFNYSAIINHGVAQSDGSFVVLLNNDTEVIAPDWIEQMLGCLMRPEVGVVGAKLLFGDGLIQHVGMAANPNGDNCHVCQNLSAQALGPNLAAALPGDYAMVTGACQMVSRRLFDEMDGYDEGLAVGFNDGDFCLRAGERGYAVTVAAGALLHHREFSTRGREVTDVRLRQRFLQEKARTMQRHAAFYAAGDPALNPNVNPYSAYFELGW